MSVNPDLVVTATTRLFGQRDLTAIDDHFGPRYTQHSTVAADGVDGLRALAANLPDGFRYEPVRVFGEDDLVVTHGVYHGFGPDPLVAFDLWRVVDGRIIEHWDALQPQVAQTVSGRSQTDGPTEVTQPELTEQNKDLVARFVDQVLVRGDLSNLTGYFAADGSYAQHNPQIGDDLSGMGDALTALAAQGLALTYTKVHRIVADGEFVLVQSEGTLGPTPTAYYDLFRVQDGKVAEHWDVVFPIPDQPPHTNGLF